MNNQDHPSRAAETPNQVVDTDLFGNPVPNPLPENSQPITVLGDIQDVSPFDLRLRRVGGQPEAMGSINRREYAGVAGQYPKLGSADTRHRAADEREYCKI